MVTAFSSFISGYMITRFIEQIGFFPVAFILGLLISIVFLGKKILVQQYEKRISKLTCLDAERSIQIMNVSKHKGLIAFVSTTKKPRPKDGEKELTDEEWLAYSSKLGREKIDNSIISKDIEFAGRLDGIGQTIRAIDCHVGGLDGLRYCWLLHSKDPGSINNLELLKYFISKSSENKIKINPICINDPNDITTIKEKISEIYTNLPDGIEAKDIIADITAGNKPMTAAMIISCLRGDRKLEYMEQSGYNLIEITVTYDTIY